MTNKELFNLPIIDRDGEVRKKALLNAANETTGEERDLLVLDVALDAVFMVDTMRLITSREQAEQILPGKMKENYDLWQAVLHGDVLTVAQRDALKGYIMGMQGSDVVKHQVVLVIDQLATKDDDTTAA